MVSARYQICKYQMALHVSYTAESIGQEFEFMMNLYNSLINNRKESLKNYLLRFYKF